MAKKKITKRNMGLEVSKMDRVIDGVINARRGKPRIPGAVVENDELAKVIAEIKGG